MVDKKGYVRIQTTLGDLNLELHCDLVPVTCHNFVQLCKKGYYDNTSTLLVVLLLTCCCGLVYNVSAMKFAA